jgi:murein DD-endopeptidase MepM/ murein hydrolase activator NlpD
MSSQTKLIKDILSLYNTILENKELGEATDVYDNVDFKDYAVGKSTPSKDTINIALLQDVQSAAKAAGVKVDITTAVSGHDKGTRHESGNAVDIAIINGKSVSPSNRADADKLVNALVSMGYSKNIESGNDKAVLTFGFEGHDNHVHVSNKTNTTSDNPTTTDTDSSSSSDDSSSENDSSSDTSNNDDSNQPSFAKTIGKSLLNAIGIHEGKIYSSFGKNFIIRHGEVIIPKEDNAKIKSPVSGVITSYSYNSSCKNQLVIEIEVDDDKFYLEYCGLNTISVRDGDMVNKGDVLGTTDSDVRVSLYDSSNNRKHIDTDSESSEKNYKKINKKNNKEPKTLGYDGMFTSAYTTVRDKWFKVDKPKKLKEDIDRIKGLLK